MKQYKAPLFRVSLSRNPHGKGFNFRISLRKGAGYMAFYLPGLSRNVAHRFRKHLYIPGVTFEVATNQKSMNPDGRVWHNRTATWKNIPKRKRLHISLRKNGNPNYCPAWW